MLKSNSIARFQSTLSVRRATYRLYCGGFICLISIHALREESDFADLPATQTGHRFQSTLSVRRATEMDRASMQIIRISIHALREESDQLL